MRNIFHPLKKKPSSKEVLAAFVLALLVFTGLGAWLFFEGPRTLVLREAQLPVVKSVVTVSRSSEEIPPVVAQPPQTVEEMAEAPIPSTPEATEPQEDKTIPTPEETQASEDVTAEAQKETQTEASVQQTEETVAKETTETPKQEETILPGKSLIPDDMVQAPLADLVEPKPVGDLPLVGAHGDKAWHMYGRFVDVDENKSQISLIVNNVGMSQEMLIPLFQKLPNTVNLAFNPYADDVDTLMQDARSNKFEPLLLTPMEPNNYPTNDPGPHALLSNVSQTQNLENLYWTLSRGTGYVGIMNYMGSDFLKNKEAMEPIFKDLNNRGLVFVDTLAGTGHSLAENVALAYGVPYITADLIIDEAPIKIEIERQLRALEILAIEFGSAVGVMDALPLSIDTVAAWSKRLENQNIVLVPLSNLIEKRMKRAAQEKNQEQAQDKPAEETSKIPELNSETTPETTEKTNESKQQ